MYIAAAALFKLLLIGGEVVEEEEGEDTDSGTAKPKSRTKTAEMKDGNPATGVEIVQSSSAAISEIEFVKCDCCGLTEECTEAYIRRVRERNLGRWICGLCTEAVKEEIGRSSEESRQIGNEEALNRHMSFCKSFRSSSPPRKPTEELISAMKQLLLRSLDSPRTPRSTPGSPMRKEGSVHGQSASLNVRSKSFYI